MSSSVPAMRVGIVPGRECEECEECCKTLAVKDIGKSKYSTCRYLKGTSPGCQLHDTADQPYACRTWQCLWKRGWLADDDRPDKTGIVSYFGGSPSGLSLYMLESRVNTLTPGTPRRENILKIMDRLGIPAQLITYEGKSVTMAIPKTMRGIYEPLRTLVDMASQTDDITGG